MAIGNFETLDLGKQEWLADRDGPWVTKTDLTQFLRCPYRVFLAHRDSIPYPEFIEPSLRNRLFARGTIVEQNVVESEAVEEALSIEEAREKGGLIQISHLIRNHHLGIKGIPDAILSEKGRLFPVEVKSHREVQPSDELELAFYWRLLEPAQKGRKDRGRKGYVFVGNGELREIPITKYRLEEADSLIAAVRKAKLEGEPPRLVPECNFCQRRDEHLPLIYRSEDLSAVFDVGPRRQTRLSELGVSKLPDLAQANVATIHSRWAQLDRYAPSEAQL